MKRLLLLAGSLLAVAGSASGDIVHLKDGTTVEGEIRKSADGWVVVRDGKITTVSADRVASIELKPLVTADSAMARLQSLRRAVENLSDLKSITERYQSFIAQNRDTPAAQEARADLEDWRAKEAQGLLKMGDRWVTTAERDSVRAKSSETAVQIHGLLVQNRLKEAQPLLNRALMADPLNPSLLYLRGVLEFQQDQFAPARKDFEQVATTLTDHPPTLNNLGVIYWRQNNQGAALGYFDRAMIAAPANRDILDNILEAINSMTPETRKSAIAQKVLRRFQEQDEQLQKQQKEKGQFRWGSSWVDEKQKAKLEEQEKVVNDELADLQKKFDDTQSRLTACERRVSEVQQSIAAIQAASLMQTNDGRVIQLAYPPSYFQFQTELDNLRITHASLASAIDHLRTDARQARLKLPQAKFTGVQKLIGADGMPLPLPPTTAPVKATAP